MIKMYREKSKIEAERFDGSQKSVFGYKIVPDLSVKELNGNPVYYFVLTGDDFEDGILIEKGDWILNDGTDIYQLENESFKHRCEQLPVIPKGVEEYFQSVRDKEKDNEHIDAITVILGAIKHARLDLDTFRWITNNGDDFARAWLDGYQVEADNETRR